MIWRLAHNIGTETHSNYNTREQIANCSEPIGFDGIYYNVLENMDVLKGKQGILFVMGEYVGKDNTFDLPYVPKLERYCSWKEILEIATETGFEVGWHTQTHPDLTKLNKRQIMDELYTPFPMESFAYPYGRYNDLVIECVKEAGFKRAFSVTQGSTNPHEKDYNFKIYRDYIK